MAYLTLMMRDNISIFDLQSYLEYMTPEQVERFHNYLAHKPISKPFTRHELDELEKLKIQRLFNQRFMKGMQ